MPIPLWLAMLLLFTGSLLFFGRVYRTALAWFVRGGQHSSWEARAELATIAASTPFALTFGLMGVEISLFLCRLAIGLNLPLLHLQEYLDFFSANKFYFVAVISLLHLLRTVPQSIASSKVYAYDLGEKLRRETLS